MRILLLGLDSAGKSTILQSLKLGKSSQTVPTIGFNVEKVVFKNLELNIWDVGGQDKLRPFWRHYYAGTSGIIFVVDSQDIDRLEKASYELHSLLKEDDLLDVVVAVIANKQDMPNCLHPDKVRIAMRIDDLHRTSSVFPAVATTGEGLADALDWLYKNMKPI